jgi:RNase P protein component
LVVVAKPSAAGLDFACISTQLKKCLESKGLVGAQSKS